MKVKDIQKVLDLANNNKTVMIVFNYDSGAYSIRRTFSIFDGYHLSYRFSIYDKELKKIDSNSNNDVDEFEWVKLLRLVNGTNNATCVQVLYTNDAKEIYTWDGAIDE